MNKYGLIGKKLGHSFSHEYFNEKFHEEHIDAVYLNFELEHISEIGEVLAEHPELRGFNVTIPYKEEIIPYLHLLDEVAAEVKAVNTVCIEIDGTLSGFNTDVTGFRDSLADFYEEGPGGKALILGSGGASKAVNFALRHYFEFEQIDIASRHQDHGPFISYPDLHKSGLSDYQLIINCTPVGMSPDHQSFPDLPYETLKPGSYLHDLVYNPEYTAFMQKGRVQHCHVKSGMEMLIHQADAAWKLWNT